jgi:hypothetical protein
MVKLDYSLPIASISRLIVGIRKSVKLLKRSSFRLRSETDSRRGELSTVLTKGQYDELPLLFEGRATAAG